MTIRNLDAIDKLSNEGWCLQSWDVRYGSGFYLMIGPHYIDQIRDITWGADIEAVHLDFYFNDEGSWLPVVQAETVSEGLAKLNNKISQYLNKEQWKNAVFVTLERIVEVNDGHYGLKQAVDKKDEYLMKPNGI